MAPKDAVTIFTDGSSRGNPGPGGWGSIVATMDKIVELGSHEKNTTNNRMEIQAAIGGIAYANEHCVNNAEILVYTDSSYLINGITRWIYGWKKNGWKTQNKADVLNQDLWEKLDGIKRKVIWKYVGGHIGIVGNERCDEIATTFADGKKVTLYKGTLAGYHIPNILNISYDESKALEKSSNSSRSRAKAYSYISSINGVVKVHHSWAECEERVKGVVKARFKKALDGEEERAIILEFRKGVK